MSILTDLAEAWPLALIAGGVGFIATFGRDPKADERDEHDVSDYHEPAPVNDAPRSLARFEQLDEQSDYVWTEFDEILPPAPPGMDAGSPLFRAVTVSTVVPTLTDDEVRQRADEWLREIAAEAVAR